MNTAADSHSETYIQMLDGPYGNPYLEMRTQRTREMLCAVIPRAARYLDRALIDDAAAQFWRSEGPQTRFYRGAALLAAHALRDTIPSSWWRELVAFECLRWEVGYARGDTEVSNDPPFEWTMHLRTHPSLRWMRAEHAIHEDFEGVPTRAPTFLCLHRKDDDSIETRWMGAFEYEFLGQLQADEPALETLRRGVEARKPEERENYIYRVSDIVGQLLASKAVRAEQR